MKIKEKPILTALILAIFMLISFALQAKELPPNAQKVYTGIYLMNLYDLNVDEFSFYADFYIWFKWKGERDPTNIEFVNAVEKWGFTEEIFNEEPLLLPDGYHYNGMRVEGRFYHSFILDDFPLDQHNLDIRIESVDFPLDSLVYVPDTSTVFFRKDLLIPGWEISGADILTNENFYNTNFGEPGRSGAAFSNFTFHLNINRPFSYFGLKLMLPLIVVILASLGGLFVHPNYIDARISLPIGGLLSCVFLQQAYSDALPDVGEMVLMDRIYLLSYLLIALIMLRVIIVGNKIARNGKEEGQNLKRYDRRRAVWYFVAYLASIGVLILLT
ncbi:MAG: hypothetical protein IPJ74_12080 [Saprospiraceae bacterium]|nr:hypothetical protein [Saprospiraceae bacterium]